MALRTIVKQIKAKQLFGFFRFFIKNPFFTVATFFATLRTYAISEKKFPKIHGRHNKPNAFRHALWNILIAHGCFRFSKNENKVSLWAKDITDWHEDLFINDPLHREMDLHNNKIGRDLFISNSSYSREEFIALALASLQTAKKVRTIAEISKTNHELVYLDEE